MTCCAFPRRANHSGPLAPPAGRRPSANTPGTLNVRGCCGICMPRTRTARRRSNFSDESVHQATHGRGRPRRTHAVLLSIVISCYNESEVLPLMCERLTSVMDSLKVQAEVILVDDGSRDDTAALMWSYTERDPRYRAVFLSRNYGHQIALTAGDVTRH